MPLTEFLASWERTAERMTRSVRAMEESSRGASRERSTSTELESDHDEPATELTPAAEPPPN